MILGTPSTLSMGILWHKSKPFTVMNLNKKSLKTEYYEITKLRNDKIWYSETRTWGQRKQNMKR